MTTPRLVISHPGRRTETIELAGRITTLGRRRECTVQLAGSDVSREHAEIASEARGFVLRDLGSKFGTFVNGQRAAEHVLCDKDRIRLGRSSDCDIVFVAGGASAEIRSVNPSGDLRQLATLLEGLRALGSGRVLDDVLTMVIDSAIEVTAAERGFIMLVGAGGALDFKIGRARGRITLPGRTFETSRKIPVEVYSTGKPRILNLEDAAMAEGHSETREFQIRYVLCVPLVLVRFVERAEADSGETRIGVLYLDSRVGGVLTSPETQAALEALAGEAAVAIENARLYRDSCEKARLEHELQIAGQIQQALLPRGEHAGACFEVAGASISCRAIGGDFFDYLELENGGVGVALADVSGKGAPAALLTAAVQGMFTVEAASAGGPAGTLDKINRGLKRRNLESRFVTMFCGELSPDGRFVYCNGGHNAPVLLHQGGVSRLETGGTILGLFAAATYDQGVLTLEPGDALVLFSDGISEAQNTTGEDYGDGRLIACLEAIRGASPAAMRDGVLASVRAFASGAMPTDDMTVLVLRYRRPRRLNGMK
jgi:sigma-B regulation protein RsbU (phosphoserine phosphatase)